MSSRSTDRTTVDDPQPLDLVRQGALVVVNHSGGKDSQALLIHLVEDLRIPLDQILVMHADLGPSEWEGTQEHAAMCAAAYGLPLTVTHALDAAGKLKSIPAVAEQRGKFPDKARRWCTSDFKRGPIRRSINAHLKQVDWPSPYVLNVLGLRAQESRDRAELPSFAFATDASCPAKPWPSAATTHTSARRRLVFDWLPILDKSEDWVFSRIAAAGQKPHYAYSIPGVTRLSCTICIFSSVTAIRAAAAHSAAARDYARDIIRVEHLTGHSILPPRKIDGRMQPVFLAQILPELA